MAGNTVNDDLGGVIVPPPIQLPPEQEGTSGTTTTPPVSDTQSQSSQSQTTVNPDAALPYLIFPMMYNSPEGSKSNAAFLQEITNKQHEIANKVMEGWVASVRKEAERIHQMITSPEFLAKMQAESATTLGQSQALLLNQLQHAYQTRINIAEGVSNYINQAKADGSKVAVPMLAITFLLGGAAIGAYLTAPGAEQTAQVPAGDTMSFSGLFDQSVVAISPDMRAELGLLGTLMASTAMYQAAATNFVAEPEEPEDKKDLTFSRTYASNIIDLVRSRSLDAYINGIVLSRIHDGVKMSEERKAELAAVVKAMMVVSAIGLMNKVELGHLTGMEFTDLVNGKLTSLPKDDVRWQLVALLNGFLGQLKPSERDRLMASFNNFMDSDPSVGGMLNIGRLFSGVLAQMPQSQRLHSQKF